MPSRQCLLSLTLGMFGLSLLTAPVIATDPAAGPGPALKPPPAMIDLRPKLEAWGLTARSQSNRPTCSVFTFTSALEFAVAQARQSGERLSVEFLNWAANQTGRAVRDGGFFSELWDGYAAHGICAEKEMPYQAKFDPARSPEPPIQTEAKEKRALGLQLHWIKKWNVNTGLSDDELGAIKQTLAAGWPVCGGFRWPKHDQWQDEVLQMCPPEEVFDGHSVLLVGYRADARQPGGGVFIFRNTNRGGLDGYMPYAYAQAYLNDAGWIESKPKENRSSAADKELKR